MALLRRRFRSPRQHFGPFSDQTQRSLAHTGLTPDHCARPQVALIERATRSSSEALGASGIVAVTSLAARVFESWTVAGAGTSLALLLHGEGAAISTAGTNPDRSSVPVFSALATFVTLVRWRYETTRRIEGLDLGRVHRRCARASRVPGYRPALIFLWVAVGRQIMPHGPASGALRLSLLRPRTGKWVRARYVATREEIAARYAEWEILGPAEIRDVDPEARYFTPHATLPPKAESRPNDDRPPELRPIVDADEAFLLAVFLLRYVTYCARRGRFAAMNGAAQLFRELDAAGGL